MSEPKLPPPPLPAWLATESTALLTAWRLRNEKPSKPTNDGSK